MPSKTWTVADIRALARRAVEGRTAVLEARGEYLRALVGSAQLELAKTPDLNHMAAVKAVHRKFYPVVQEATATPDIKLDKKQAPAERKRRALERNRRTNFARSAYGTIRRWLRAPGHDLTKLDAMKVTKSQLLNEAPPTRKHALTPQRIKARADRLVDQLVGFAKQVAKADAEQAMTVLREAMDRLSKQLEANEPGSVRRIGTGRKAA